MPAKTDVVSNEIKLQLYSLLYKTRATEDRIIALYRQGRIMGGVYTGRGVEATTVAAGLALEKQDYLFPIHRDLGAHLAKGQSVLNILLQYLGRGNSLTKGKDSGIHMSDTTLNIIGNVSHLGAMIPVAVGVAMAKKMQNEKVVTLNFIGEGGSNIGDFHEGLNFAAVHKAPFVLVIENNQYAYSTPAHKEYVCNRLSDRAQGYGIPGYHIDGTDALGVYATIKKAIEDARNGKGPSLIECLSMRMVGHSAHDDAFYVDKEQMKKYEKKDPFLRLEQVLRKEGLLDDKQIKRIQDTIDKEIEQATDIALNSPLPEAHWAAEGVYAE
ncbi:thiamine pyrophosphate-dependent dehydrogenase E1 component subunit alpha [candidate division KSB1 bacterium]|nr:thiamine pyrophosphate-dependent dehydrogenase E1 component subunit alpha [candidate division KSB1 bacterium]